MDVLNVVLNAFSVYELPPYRPLKRLAAVSGFFNLYELSPQLDKAEISNG